MRLVDSAVHKERAAGEQRRGSTERDAGAARCFDKHAWPVCGQADSGWGDTVRLGECAGRAVVSASGRLYAESTDERSDCTTFTDMLPDVTEVCAQYVGKPTAGCVVSLSSAAAAIVEALSESKQTAKGQCDSLAGLRTAVLQPLNALTVVIPPSLVLPLPSATLNPTSPAARLC